MLMNLFLGAAVISATVVIHTIGLIGVTFVMTWLTNRSMMDRRHNQMLAMVTTVIGIFVVLTFEVWLWAFVHFELGVLKDFETTLYFSIVSFSTLGYGDFLPEDKWRIFAGLEGINGFLLIGWSTAYLVAAGIRVGPFRPGEHF